MLKKVMAALLATVAFMPAAQAQDDQGQDGRDAGMSRRGEMRQVRERAAEARREAPQQAQRAAQVPRAEQAQRFERQPAPPRPAPQVQAQAQPQPQRQWQGYGDRGSRGNMFAERAQRQQAEAQAQGNARQRDGNRDRGDQQGDWRRNDAGRNQAFAGDQRRVDDARRADANRRADDQRRWNDNGRNWNDNDRRYGGANTNWNGRDNWSRRWRDDNRYDWGRYRQQNRNLFRLPRYYAPYNWSYGYRRFSVGVTLSSLLWSQDYWIDDPAFYRLPPAYGPYRWVRYYNDALLVDLRTGYVVDTVYDIFW